MMFQRLRTRCGLKDADATNTSAKKRTLPKRSRSNQEDRSQRQRRQPSSSSSSSVTDDIQKFDFLNEPTYLLAKCQKHGSKLEWRCIQRCCNLIGLAASNSPSLVEAAQQQFLQKDLWDNTPLHIICYHKPPASVIEALLRAAARCFCDDMASQLLLTMAKNDKGATPLIVACRSGSCRNSVNSLIAPRGCGKAITMCDDEGSSVFDALLNRYSLVRRIPALRSRWTELKNLKKEDIIGGSEDNEIVNGTSMDDSIRSTRSTTSVINDDAALGFVEFLTATTFLPNDESSPPPHLFPLFWRINKDLLRSAWDTEAPPETPYISDLRGAALVADALPEQLIDMIIRFCGDDDSHDDEENTAMLSPVGLALMRRMSSKAHPKNRRQHAYFVQQMLERSPSSCDVATTSSSNGGGRSLFCQAIASGHHWNLAAEHEEEDRSADELQGPVQTLFRCSPDAILDRDTETGLMPFMLAATIDDGGQQKSGAWSNLQLDTIYNLLRASPQTIQS